MTSYVQITAVAITAILLQCLNRILILYAATKIAIWVENVIKQVIYEPGHEKMCLMPYVNNKGADQPAHPRSLISAFVFAV